VDVSALVARLRQRLMGEASPTGGWPYYPGKQSRIEPTAWALLAVTETWPGDSATRQQFIDLHVRFLASCQRTDGLLTEQQPTSINFTANGLSACATASLLGDGSSSFLRRLTDGLVGAKGVALSAQDPNSNQDNRLQGWPWIPDTFSWVEPTAWCLLALKKTRALGTSDASLSRIREAEKLLANRSCKSGGWNYGNATVFGQDLRAYVPTTAAGLMALQDRRGDPAVSNALAFLEGARLKETSGMALALTAVALRLYEQSTSDVEERLVEIIGRAERSGNLQTLAMALYALSGDRHGAKAFRFEAPPTRRLADARDRSALGG
jgi:hypothetical protein